MSGRIATPEDHGSEEPAASIPAALALLGAVAAAAISASVWLLPGPLERGRIALDRGDSAAMHAVVQAAVERHETRPGAVAPLVALAMELGDTASATTLLHGFLARQPDSLPAQTLLAEVLTQARQSRELAPLLEQLYERTGDVEQLRRATVLRGQLHQPDRREHLLARLADIGQADSEETLELAHDRFSRGDAAGAVDLLLARIARDDRPDTALVTHAGLLAVDLPDAAARLARLGTLLTRPASLPGVLQVVAGLQTRSRPDLALALLTALPDALQQPADVSLAIADAQSRTGATHPALTRLLALRGTGMLPQAGAALLADLALRDNQPALAVDVAASIPTQAMPAWLPLRLAEILLPAGRMDLLDRLPSDALTAQPSVAALVSARHGDTASATRLARAAFDLPPATPAVLRAYVHLLGDLHLDDAAFSALLGHLRDGAAPDAATVELLAALATTPARSGIVLPLLARARDTVPGAANAWCILALASNRSAEVANWLRHGGHADPAVVLSLLTRAVQDHDHALADTAATLLLAAPLPAGWSAAEIRLLAGSTGPLNRPRLDGWLDFLATATPDARLRATFLLAGSPDLAATARAAAPALANHPAVAALLADAGAGIGGPDAGAARLQLLAALSPRAALPLLATAALHDPAHLGPAWVAAVFQTSGDPAGQAALRTLLPRLSHSEAEASLFRILATLPAAQAGVVQQVAADMLGGSWVSAWEETLAHTGRIAELEATLRARGAAVTTSAAEGRGLAWRLTELGDRSGAIALLRHLGEGQPPDSESVKQLVYLWGPRPLPEAVDWVRTRAVAAPPDQLASWLAHLDYLDAPGTIAEIVEARADLLPARPALVESYVAALGHLGTPRRGLPLLQRALARTGDPLVFSAIGRAAEAMEQPLLALQADAAAAAARPQDPAARLAAARAALAARRPSEAAREFQTLLALHSQPPRVLLEAGEALVASRQADKAAPLFAAALAGLPAHDTSTDDQRLRAQVLRRTDHAAEATVLLRQILARHPNDAGVQADLLELRIAAETAR